MKSVIRKARRMPRAVVAVAVLVALPQGALVSIPNYLRRPRRPKDRAGCIASLKPIKAVKAVATQENKKGTNAVPEVVDLFGPGNYVDKKPHCHRWGTTYTVGNVVEKPRCSAPNHKWE